MLFRSMASPEVWGPSWWSRGFMDFPRNEPCEPFGPQQSKHQKKPRGDADFGQHSKHSFWLPLSVRNVDEAKALEKIRGEEFAGARLPGDSLGVCRSCVPELSAAGNFSQFLRSLTALSSGTQDTVPCRL